MQNSMVVSNLSVLEWKQLPFLDKFGAKNYICQFKLGGHCVPISNSINKSLLHGSMDNFDCIENTKSGTSSSHDTILMVLENQKGENDTW